MRNPGKKVRYAVVGLGYIAQAAVLPAFAHARH
jgi:predicted dehydrogenase